MGVVVSYHEAVGGCLILANTVASGQLCHNEAWSSLMSYLNFIDAKITMLKYRLAEIPTNPVIMNSANEINDMYPKYTT
jgi:hypothetical protein